MIVSICVMRRCAIWQSCMSIKWTKGGNVRRRSSNMTTVHLCRMSGDAFLCVWFWVLPPLQLLENQVTPTDGFKHAAACRSTASFLGDCWCLLMSSQCCRATFGDEFELRRRPGFASAFACSAPSDVEAAWIRMHVCSGCWVAWNKTVVSACLNKISNHTIHTNHNYHATPRGWHPGSPLWNSQRGFWRQPSGSQELRVSFALVANYFGFAPGAEPLPPIRG